MFGGEYNGNGDVWGFVCDEVDENGCWCVYVSSHPSTNHSGLVISLLQNTKHRNLCVYYRVKKIIK